MGHGLGSMRGLLLILFSQHETPKVAVSGRFGLRP